MNLFIDSNIYLTFYHFSNDDLEELKKLKVAIQDGRIRLILTDQVMEEFKRNRETKIADALKKFNEQKIPAQFPQICKDYPQYEKLRTNISEYEALKGELLDKLMEDIKLKQLGADQSIEELFGVATRIETTELILSSAKDRYDKGNPPGKNGSYGDAINWESLLSFKRKDWRQSEIIEDIHFVARDKDYLSPIDTNKFSQFLEDEWENKKNSEIHFYKNLTDFFSKNFPDIKLAVDLERQFAISNFVASPSFASTHLAVSRVSKYTDFTEQEVKEIVEGCLTNSQISAISSDTDVHSFVKDLIEKYSEQIEPEKIEQLVSLYEIAFVSPSQPPSPKPDEIDIPF